MPGPKAAVIPPERFEEAKQAFTTEGPNKTAKRFGLSPNTFRRIAKENGWTSPREVIESTQAPYTQEQIDQIILAEYPTLGSALTKVLPFSAEKIRKDAIRLGINSEFAQKLQRNAETFNPSYFKTWNPTVAADLGYAWSDGTTQYKTGTTIPSCYHLKCHRQDEDWIIGTRDRIGSQHYICRYEQQNSSGTISPMTRIAIASQALTRSLIEVHGILPNKSNLDLPFPTIPPALLCHFARGYHNGDGSAGIYSYVHKSGNPKVQRIISYQGSPQFIHGLLEALFAEVPVTRISPTHAGYAKTRTIQWQSQDDIRKLYQWMYPEGDYPILPRKKSTIEALI
jgi:hypothetical protein